MPNLNLSHSLDDLMVIGDSFSSRSGCGARWLCGWSAGQLESEMQRHAWLTHPATLDLVFHPEPQHLWSLILGQKGWRYRLLAESPEDLASN